MTRRSLMLLSMIALSASARPAARPDAGAPAALSGALATVRAAAVRAHVEFLADDLLEGRLAGTRGYDLAARYVAAQLGALGLQPAGDHGTFFQAVPLLESRLEAGTLAITAPGGGSPQSFTPREDFAMAGDLNRTESRVEAPVVFAGFGVSAPELSHDDYASRDVRGKIVAVLTNAPAAFPSEQRAHHASGRLKARLAADRGAVGLLVLRTPDDEKTAPWARMMANPDEAAVAWLGPDGAPADAPTGLLGVAVLSASGVKKLFSASPVAFDTVVADAAKGSPRGFDLPVTASLSSRSTHRRVASANVVGLLKGSDPRLADTSLVYSAHLDHIGVGGEVDGDRIYNGAYDNALGVASLLEAARALASLSTAPARSIAFVFVTAEEKGLVGSDYFAATPPAAIGRPIANVNLDMPLLLFPIDKVVAFGGEHSTIGKDAARAAAWVKLTLIPDPMPELNLFVRSDQYSFVRRGVPSVFFVPAFSSSDPKVDGPARFQEFLAKHYHRPSDEIDLPVDAAAVEQFTRANVALGYLIASSPAAPQWTPESFFGKTFGGQ